MGLECSIQLLIAVTKRVQGGENVMKWEWGKINREPITSAWWWGQSPSTVTPHARHREVHGPASRWWMCPCVEGPYSKWITRVQQRALEKLGWQGCGVGLHWRVMVLEHCSWWVIQWGTGKEKECLISLIVGCNPRICVLSGDESSNGDSTTKEVGSCGFHMRWFMGTQFFC